ncbi:MAG TPA: dihydrofolate reductase family protein [Acidimicrobiia bacterium]|nr:dihydrofolate reductase family protein [Acidimicrobiia bacterium]
MGKIRFNVSISLDGYMAGPDQTEENPLGVGGMELHNWLFDLEAWRESHGESGGRVDASTPVVHELETGYGSVVMGRNMFGPIRGEWGADPWRGWWGDNPPYHKPVFVLTHYGREPLEMDGGTTFHFVTDGFDSAMDQALTAADDADVLVAGGASVIRHYLANGVIDEFWLSLVPLLLGSGERPLDGIPSSTNVELVDVIAAPKATHLKYVVR